MLTSRHNSPPTSRVGASLTALFASMIIATTVSATAHADEGFVRSTNDNRQITVQATKPGAAGGKPATSSSGKGTSAAKPIAAGTTTKLDLSDLVIAHNKQIIIPECWDGTLSTNGCQPTNNPTTPAPPAAAAPTRADAETIARTLISRLQLPAASPQIGPDPSLNEWNMAVVGVPYWIWTDTPTTLTTHATGYGITITMNATRTHLTINPGDGTTLVCATTTPYPPTAAVGATSPTCGHTYTWPSRTKTNPQGTYQLTATAHWNVHWTALGYTGTIPVDVTDTRDIPVTELHALARVP